jgi:hypothetical protein
VTTHAAITLQALVTPAEQAAMTRAAEQLAGNLSAADSDAEWLVDVRFVDGFDQVEASDDAVVVVSLLPEVDRDEAWATTEQRVRGAVTGVLEAGVANLFLCTVLRHAGGADEPAEAVVARRTRIRRLNMLAINLSQEFGVFVVDIDRDLAAIGARALDTDYRLGGDFAAGAAGKSIAMSLLLIGLDAFVPVELQTAARERLAEQPVPQLGVEGPRLRVAGGKAVAVRGGGRRQVIEAALDTEDDSMVAQFIELLLKGKLPIRDAVGLVVGVVRRRGLRASAVRVFGGMRKVVALSAARR